MLRMKTLALKFAQWTGNPLLICRAIRDEYSANIRTQIASGQPMECPVCNSRLHGEGWGGGN